MKLVGVIYLAVVAIVVAGCGEGAFEQDPYKGYSKAITDGVPPEKAPTEPVRKPVEREFFSIDIGGEILEFTENQVTEKTMRVRALGPVKDLKLTFEVDGILPGARLVEQSRTENSVTYKLTWRPPVGSTRGKLLETVSVNFLVSAVGEETLGQLVPSKILVNKFFTVPDLVEVRFDRNDMGERETSKVSLLIRDPDTAEEAGRFPMVEFVKPAGKDASDMIRLVSRDFDKTTNLFRFVYEFSGSNRNLVSKREDFAIRARVRSVYNSISSEKEAKISVNNTLQEPAISLINDTAFEFQIGQKNSMTYTIMDPDLENKLLNNVITKIVTFPGRATVSCNTADNTKPWIITCRFDWDMTNLTMVYAPTYTVEFEGVVVDPSGIKNAVKRVRVRINTKQPPPPPPPPITMMKKSSEVV